MTTPSLRLPNAVCALWEKLEPFTTIHAIVAETLRKDLIRTIRDVAETHSRKVRVRVCRERLPFTMIRRECSQNNLFMTNERRTRKTKPSETIAVYSFAFLLFRGIWPNPASP